MAERSFCEATHSVTRCSTSAPFHSSSACFRLDVFGTCQAGFSSRGFEYFEILAAFFLDSEWNLLFAHVSGRSNVTKLRQVLYTSSKRWFVSASANG